MNLKKILGWTVVIFAAYYLFRNPTGAAAAAQHGFHILSQAGSSAATFLTSL
jgi:hypothetical protein